MYLYIFLYKWTDVLYVSTCKKQKILKEIFLCIFFSFTYINKNLPLSIYIYLFL